MTPRRPSNEPISTAARDAILLKALRSGSFGLCLLYAVFAVGHAAFLPPHAQLWFPPASDADENGLLAIGGDLSPERLLLAYRGGIFPWYDEDMPPLWWSPDPRAVLDPESLRVSRSMRRFCRNTQFKISFNRAFREVMQACGDTREDGTWILPEMLAAYVRLHELGWAHSVEVWATDGTLAGGLYGVAVGALFAAESMFHRVADASKVAVVALVQHARRVGTTLLDVQMPTEHLATLGAQAISREEYLTRLAAAVRRPVAFAA